MILDFETRSMVDPRRDNVQTLVIAVDGRIIALDMQDSSAVKLTPDSNGDGPCNS